MAEFNSFLWQHNISLNKYNHSFFIHVSIYAHLGYFHVLAILKNATENMGLQISF